MHRLSRVASRSFAAPRRPPMLLLLLASLGAPATALAEEPPALVGPWHVSLGTGGGGFVEFVDAFSNGGPASYDTTRRRGRLQVNARVERQARPNLLVGVSWTWNRWTEDYFAGGTRVGSIENSVHSVLVGGSVQWFRAEYLELYTGLAAGAGRLSQAGSGIGSTQTGVQSGFAFQLRGLGLSAGNERFRAFAEVGLGFEGLLIAGATLRF